MSDITTPAGAPEEVVTKAFVREIDLSAFGATGTLALITIDNGLDHTRPNTLGPKSLQELDNAITQAENSSAVAIAITGKPFIFAAGADLSGLPFVTEKSQSLAIGKLGHDIFKRLGRSKKTTFAFINGLALGGGLEVGLHCNYRTMASTAMTALPECFLGIVPGWGGATILPKLIGPERAVQVIILNALNNNTMMKAKDAHALGVIDAVYEPADFLEPRRALELIYAARTNTLDQGFDAEDEILANLVMGNPLRASLYAFNLIQKKRKKVEGAPKPALARKVTKVGIVGAGLMASQLALLMVRNLKVPVVMTDLDQARVEKGVAWVHAEIAKLVEKKRLNEEAGRRLSLLVTGSVDQSVFAGADFIIEAVFEELSIKQKLFKDLEAIISPECILATNTSSLSVEKMGEGLKNPERVVGFHFFNPVAVMPLLEVARTSKTDDATTATAINVGKELKKTMIICKDAPGFVVNRLLTRFMGEVTDAMDEGTPADVADNALRPLGFPMSPFELFGLVGPGVALHVSKTLNANLGPRYRVSPTVQRLVDQGVKTFYVKDESGKLVPNPEAVALIEKGTKTSTSDEVRMRALKALAEEARMMLDEGVVATPAEIDLCMLLGAGWPMHLGGILPRGKFPR